MALQAIQGGLWIPSWKALGNATIDTTTFLIDATGELVALICRVPKTGNLTRFEAMIGAVANAPDNGLRFSFQGVSLTTGVPDGVIVESITTAGGSPSAAGWLNPGDFNVARAVTQGDLLALVIDIPTFVAADSVAIGGITQLTSSQVFPYSVRTLTTKSGTVLPIMALHYDDGTYAYLTPDGWGQQLVAIVGGAGGIDTGTTPDEAGLAITLPFPARLVGVQHATAVPAGGNYDLVIYDAASTPLVTLSVDGDVTGVATVGMHYHLLPTPVTLANGVVYRVILKPTTTNNLLLNTQAFNSLALMDTAEGGQSFYLTQRTDAGAWTDFNTGGAGFRKPRMWLLFDAFDDGVSAGGGGMCVAGPRVGEVWG